MAGILLAAGDSSRFSPGIKQLVDFLGEPLVRRVARRALQSNLAQLVAVVGCEAKRVADALEGLNLQIIRNKHFRQGQSTSVKRGLDAVGSDMEAAIFIPADQPYLDPELLNKLIQTYSSSPAPRDSPVIVAPGYQKRRGAPVLFNRSLFTELQSISGDEGGRQIIHRHASCLHVVELSQARSLLDIDTFEDYRNLLNLEKETRG